MIDLMENLFAAVFAHFQGSPLAAVLTGGLHNTEVPTGTACPYGVFNLPSYVHQDPTLGRAVIRIDLFSATPRAEQITTLHKLLSALYDGQLLEDALEGKNLGLEMEGCTLTREENYWRAITTFSVGIVRD